MRWTILYGVWLFTLPLLGQDLLDSLAREVCDCMTESKELVYPRLRAARCVQTVALNHNLAIRTIFRLSAFNPDDRRDLSELLIKPLSKICPELTQLAPGTVERSYSYSDIDLATPPRPAALKEPPPLPEGLILGEVAAQTTVRATYLRKISRDRILLELPNGKQDNFAVPPRILRRSDWQPGQSIQVTYRLKWYPTVGRARPSIISVQ